MILKELLPLQEKISYYSNSQELNNILENGKNKANKIAKKTMDEIYNICGLI